MSNDKSNFIDFIYIVNKWRKFIIVNFLIISVLVAAISLVIPKTFSAESIILPVSESSSFLAPIGFEGFGAGLMGFGGSEEANRLIAIIGSRNVLKTVTLKYDLQNVYEVETLEDAIEILRDFSEMTFEDDGTITVVASAKTPFLASENDEEIARILAADIANSLVEELDITNKKLKTSQGRFTRLFIEERLAEATTSLHATEDSINSFQSRFGTISLPEQIIAAIESAAEIERLIAIQEVKLAVTENVYGKDHPEYNLAKLELRMLRQKFDEMMYEGKPDSSNRNTSLFPAFETMPDLSIRFLQLEMELENRTSIRSFLLQQLEEAKIQETRDTPTLHIIDEAVPPIKRSRPIRSLLVLIAGVFTIILSLIFVFVYESLIKLKIANPAEFSKLRTIRSTFRIKKRD
ncbi:MAG: hypothetical protein O6940_13965 [Ignavibacteria bacterium]|nr:hypothetical protein [Ignavibacteria bacterium]